MGKFNRISLVIGVVLMVAGAAFIIVAFFTSPYTRFSFILTGIIFIITGAINFAVFKFLDKSFSKFPDSIKNYDTSMKGSAKRMSSMADMLKQQNNMNRLSSIGVPVKIKIINFKDTGEVVNYDSVIEFQVEVQKEHSFDNYYINSFTQIVSKVIVSRLKVGDVYPAKVDPEDKNNIYISWL